MYNKSDGIYLIVQHVAVIQLGLSMGSVTLSLDSVSVLRMWWGGTAHYVTKVFVMCKTCNVSLVAVIQLVSASST